MEKIELTHHKQGVSARTGYFLKFFEGDSNRQHQSLPLRGSLAFCFDDQSDDSALEF